MTLGTPMHNRKKQGSSNINGTDDNTTQTEDSQMLTQDERLEMNKEQLENMKRAQEEADKEKAGIKYPESNDGIEDNKDSSDSRGP